MTYFKDRNEEMKIEFEELKSNTEIVDNLVEDEFISKRLGEYIKNIADLDFSILEAIFFAEDRNEQGAAKNLINLRRYRLDNIANLFLDHNSSEIAKDYRPLFDLAKNRYDEAIIEITKIFEDIINDNYKTNWI